MSEAPKPQNQEPSSDRAKLNPADIAGRVVSTLDSVLYLAPLGLIFDQVGYIPPYLRLYFIYTLLALKICLHPSRTAFKSAGVLAGLVLVQALFSLPLAAEICLLLLAHYLVWRLHSSVPPAISTGVCVYALIHIYLFVSPLGHPLLEWCAVSASRLATIISGAEKTLGYTYQGIGPLILFLVLSVFGWDRSAVSKIRTVAFLVVCLLINGFLAALLLEYVDFGASFAWELKFRDDAGLKDILARVRGLGVLVFPILHFITTLIVYLVLHHDTKGRKAIEAETAAPNTSASKLHRAGPILLPILAVALLLTANLPTRWRNPVAGNLIFLEKGVVSFTKPDYTRYGKAAGGMYGMFPEYARLFGCTTTIVKEIPQDIGRGDVLITTNLDEPLTPEKHATLWRAVENGAHLWVLGDHTFIKNGRNHINDLLAPTGIVFANDSAQFFPQGWFHSYRFRQGTAFGGLRDLAENRPAILVGASLQLQSPAYPMVIGRFGYGDLGLSVPDEDRGYLGDFKYQSSERLGDLVLVAGQQYGKGRVLVFGDTTSFFNNNLSRSYEILRASLSWLGDSACWHATMTVSARIAIMALLLLVLLFFFFSRKGPAVTPTFAALVLASCLAHGESGLLPIDAEFARTRMACIDFSHQPFAAKHSSMDAGLHGLSINLLRFGMLPVTQNSWNRDIVGKAVLLVLNAPRESLSGRTREDIMAFMQRGGTVLLSCGYPHYESCRSLLAPLGLSVRALPLGRFFDRQAFGRRISFFSAWPIEMVNPNGSVLCLYEDKPLIVSVPVGSGQLILIGDSQFLHNRNVEGHENHDPANTEFIRGLLSYATGEPPA